MGKFIDWLFEKGDTETAEDRVFKNTSNEEVSGHVVDFKEPKIIIENSIIKYAYIGSDKLEIEFNKMDIEEFNGDHKKNKQDIFRKYLSVVIQKAYVQGYNFDTYQTDYHRIYETFHNPNQEKLISAIEEYFKLNGFYKREVEDISVNILGVEYAIKRIRSFRGYKYCLKNFYISSSIDYKVSFTKEELTTNFEPQEKEYVLSCLEERLQHSYELQEYVINNNLSKFKIKIKEQTDDVAIDMLKIDVMSLIKEDFYQYSHTVYIEKKRLYELIKNDSTFEEILEVK